MNKITVSIGLLFDRGLWESFCRVTGMSEWAVNEGQASRDEMVTLTEDQAVEIGLLR